MTPKTKLILTGVLAFAAGVVATIAYEKHKANKAATATVTIPTPTGK
jgi:hypothetical protein